MLLCGRDGRGDLLSVGDVQRDWKHELTEAFDEITYVVDRSSSRGNLIAAAQSFVGNLAPEATRGAGDEPSSHDVLFLPAPARPARSPFDVLPHSATGSPHPRTSRPTLR